MAEGEDKQLVFFDSKKMAELAEGANRPFNFHYNVFVKEQKMTTKIKGSNIERLGVGGESEGQTSTSSSEKQTYNLEMIGEEKPEDVTWLSPKLVLFKKRPISSQRNSEVYHGRQELLSGHCRDVAIKFIPYNKRNIKEIDTMMKLSHQNVVQIYDAGEYHGLKHWIYIVMELCCMDLEQYVKDNPANPEKAWQFFKQMVSAIDFMHKQNIAHRDIKPSNILISRCGNLIKFSDFGISKEIPDNLTSVTTTNNGAGTDGYRSPEAYQPDYKVSVRSDIFSFGLASAYLLSHGKHPFGDKPLDWSYKIRNNQEFSLSQIPSALPQRKHLIVLIKGMLKHAPRDRPTANQILNGLASPVSSTQRIPSANQERSTENDLPVQRSIRSNQGGERIGFRTNRRAIVLFAGNQPYRVNLEDGSLARMQKLPGDNFTAVSIDPYIYILKWDLNSVFRLKHNDVTATWENLRDWPKYHGKFRPSVVASSDAIYLVGGGMGEPKQRASKYIPSVDRWKGIKDKPTATTSSVLLCTLDHLYCIGGCFSGRGERTDRVERMNLRSETWSRIADLDKPDVQSAVEFQKKIYAFCGHVDHLSVQSWDPRINQWTNAIQVHMPNERMCYCVENTFEVDGMLYLVSSTDILEYDDEINDLLLLHSYANGKVAISDAVLVSTTA